MNAIFHNGSYIEKAI